MDIIPKLENVIEVIYLGMAQHCRSGLVPFDHYTLCRHVAAGDWYKIEFDPEFHHHTSHCIVPRPSNHSTYHQL